MSVLSIRHPLLCFTGCQDAHCRCIHLCHPVDPLQGSHGVQHGGRHEGLASVYGSLVPHVCQDVCVHQQVSIQMSGRFGNNNTSAHETECAVPETEAVYRSRGANVG